MTPAQPRTCPRAGCARDIIVASRRDIEGGAPLWRCAAGHHGPLLVGDAISVD